MKIYELMVWNRPISQRTLSSYKLPLDACTEVHRMPGMFCSYCSIRPSGNRFPIPEAEILDTNHPVLVQIHESFKRTNEIRGKTPASFVTGKSDLKAAQLLDDISGSLSPENFSLLSSALRTVLQLPLEREIYPLSRIGACQLICNTLHPPDFCEVGIGAPPMISEQSIKVLKRNAMMGWQTYPAKVTMAKTKKVRDYPPPFLWELIVTGKGGFPGETVINIDYNICSHCGFIKWNKVPNPKYLKPTEWDGSDIFYFSGMGGIYVTERLKNVVESSGLTGIFFRPPEQSYEEWDSEMSGVPLESYI